MRMNAKESQTEGKGHGERTAKHFLTRTALLPLNDHYQRAWTQNHARLFVSDDVMALGFPTPSTVVPHSHTRTH